MPSKWLRDHRKQDLRDHKKRIENMKSTIDTAPPRELPMSKRNEMERARKQALVEQDNRLLLDRLAIAMSTKNIDNVLIEKPFISLMELQRKKQLKKIMIQNSRLLDRIQCTVPSYDHVLWEKEAEHHVEILRNMTEFPDLFVAPGCHKKGYDMAQVDAERAQQKLLANRGVERSNSASPTKLRDGKSSGEKKNLHKSSMKQSQSGVNMSGDGSPHSQQSKGSGYVPYSYFPEEQYAQYQMQLQMQMQLQAQQQQMQMQSQGQSPQQFQQQYPQQGQYVQSSPYVQSNSPYSTGVPLAPTLTPEQQYAHQQQVYLYHQQQQQRMNYNNTANNNTSNNANVNPQVNTSGNVYPSQPYYYNNSTNTPQLAPIQNTNTNTNNTNANTSNNYSPQYAQYSNSSTPHGVQLPNIYEYPPGHMAQPPY